MLKAWKLPEESLDLSAQLKGCKNGNVVLIDTVGAIDGVTQKERAFSQVYTTLFRPTAKWIVLAVSRVHLSPLVIVPSVIPLWVCGHRYIDLHSLVLEISSLSHIDIQAQPQEILLSFSR